MYGLLCSLPLFGFEMAMVVYSFGFWYESHPGNKELVEWDRIVSLVLAFSTGLQMIVYVVQEVNRSRIERNADCLIYFYFMNQVFCNLFMAVYSIFGIVYYERMDPTTDQWFKYGTIVLIIYAFLSGCVVYLSLLLTLIFCCMFGCTILKLSRDLEQVPQGPGGQVNPNLQQYNILAQQMRMADIDNHPQNVQSMGAAGQAPQRHLDEENRALINNQP